MTSNPLITRFLSRKIGLLAALAVVSLSPGARADEAPARTPRLGGLGWAFVGGWFGLPRGLEGALRAPEALGAGTELSAASLLFGGGGGMLVAGRLWIGGKGFGALHRVSGASRGSASLSAGGGGLELGYAAVNNGKVLVVPFLGVGGMRYGLDLEAPAGEAIARSGATLAPAGGSASLGAGLATAELGARFSQLIFWGSKGMAVGVEVGGLASLNSARWRAGGNDVDALPSTRFTGGYARLTVGGGGFFFE